jgi:hypothetical protein
MQLDGRLVCDAGRRVLPGEPECQADLEAAGRVHVIYATEGDVPGGAVHKIELCDRHFDLVNGAGHVTEPYAGRDTVRQRIGREPD